VDWQRRNVLGEFVLPEQQNATELDPELFAVHPDDRAGYTKALMAHHNGVSIIWSVPTD
jgi:hypothetical protein